MDSLGNSRALKVSGRAGLFVPSWSLGNLAAGISQKAPVLLTQKIIVVNLHDVLHTGFMLCLLSPTTGTTKAP